MFPFELSANRLIKSDFFERVFFRFWCAKVVDKRNLVYCLAVAGGRGCGVAFEINRGAVEQ